jgi:hypothetical protein
MADTINVHEQEAAPDFTLPAVSALISPRSMARCIVCQLLIFDAPPPFILRFFPKLLRAAALTNGKQQLNRVAANQKAKNWDRPEIARSSLDG